MGHVRIDEKYTVEVEDDSTVKVFRHGFRWLENPEGSKAWIAAAEKIVALKEQVKEISPKELSEAEQIYAANRLAAHLSSVWGWPENDPEIQTLAKQLAAQLGAIVHGTSLTPEALLLALLTPND